MFVSRAYVAIPRHDRGDPVESIPKRKDARPWFSLASSFPKTQARSLVLRPSKGVNDSSFSVYHRPISLAVPFG
jgi:hypothetical protein